MFESFEKKFTQPPQESKEGFESDKEKIEQEAARERGELLNNVLGNVFTEKGDVKKPEVLQNVAISFLKKKSNLFRSLIGAYEATEGKTVKGKKLTTVERVVRGAAGVGSGLVWISKAAEHAPQNIFSGPDEEHIKDLEEKIEPYLRDMADYEIKGNTEDAMREAAKKKEEQGNSQSAEILEKTADFMKDHPEETQKAESDIQEILEQKEIFESKE